MPKKVVMAFGSFDLLHPGHLDYLNKASKFGDRLIVVVARDSSIKRFKGRAPVFNQKERAAMVGALKVVDRAVVGNKIRKREDIYRIILQHRPSVVVFGYDQKVDIKGLNAWLLSKGLHPKIVRIRSSLKRKSYKSSIIRKRMDSSDS